MFTCLVACVAVACGGPEPTFERDMRQIPARKRVAPRAAGVAGPLTAHRFAEVSDVIGPYVGRDGELSLAAWAEASGSGRSLTVAPIDAQGVPGRAVRIGNIAPELDLVLVRGFGAASSKTAGQPRFAVVTTRRSEQKSRIDLAALRADGSAIWGPTTLAERNARVLWVGFVVTGEQPLVLWAEQPSGARPGDPATLFGLPVSVDGRQTVPALISSKACVWQTAVVAGQAALASVRAGSGGCSSGTVSLDLLSGSGKSEKTIDVGGRAALDLDLVAGPDAFVLAWSDREQLEPRALSAIVEPRGALRAPAAAAVPGVGEQAVVALVSGETHEAPAFLVWENVADRPDGARFFEISALDAAGRASGAHSRLLYSRVDGGAPELTANAGGVAALTLAPACDTDGCEGSPPVPTFVALDAGLKLRTSQPLLLDGLGGRAADLGWGLTCQARGCFALAAPSRSPASLFSVPLPLRPTTFRAAAEEVAPLGKPRVIASDVLLSAPAPLSQIAVNEQQGRSLVGYVTDFDPTTPWQKLSKPAEDGRLEPLRARAAVRPFKTDGAFTALGDEQVISLRAHSLGGLALLGDGASAKESLALWAGLDKGEPQIFLTGLGPDG
ncbi:MAG TPA: hypothetical protein VEQ58_01765, partial [Polyangiaceae bacterium]|nr:hypothetical protein [Polyangiaceae bacterium]